MPPLVEAHQARTSLQSFPGENEVSFALCHLQEGSPPGFLIFFSGENQTLNFSAIVTELYLLFPCYFWSAPRSVGWKRLTWFLWQHFHVAWGKGICMEPALRASHSNVWKRRRKNQKTLLLFQWPDMPCGFLCVLVHPYSLLAHWEGCVKSRRLEMRIIKYTECPHSLEWPLLSQCEEQGSSSMAKWNGTFVPVVSLSISAVPGLLWDPPRSEVTEIQWLSLF